MLFADIAGFTQLSATLTATELVSLLDDLFRRFDALCDVHEIEKIKTIGDAYMGVAGVPAPSEDHAAVAAAMALDMLQVARYFDPWPGGLSLRVGISSGPVVAGVIGDRKFANDLWGTRSTRRAGWNLTVNVKGKGKGVMTTYQLLSRLAPRPG